MEWSDEKDKLLKDIESLKAQVQQLQQQQRDDENELLYNENEDLKRKLYNIQREQEEYAQNSLKEIIDK